VIVVLIFSNLDGAYSRLSAEKDVANVVARDITGKQYKLELIFDSGKSKCFLINGYEWLIDIRIIKWKNRVKVLGLDRNYHLDRLI
jgi:hypothetical protein